MNSPRLSHAQLFALFIFTHTAFLRVYGGFLLLAEHNLLSRIAHRVNHKYKQTKIYHFTFLLVFPVL